MNDVIDVYYGDIESGVDLDRMMFELSDAEIEFAKTLRNHRRQMQYLSTRYQIRRVLACYLNVTAKDVEILKSEHGKPYLAEGMPFFNVSHSGDKLAIAVTDIGDVGIDIEQDKKRYSLHALAERCFAPEELTYWSSLDIVMQTQVFYRFWTGKEAYVKAIGRGIALGLERCVINPAQPDRFQRLPQECGRSEAWRLLSFETDPAYCGAVAIESGDKPVCLQRKQLPLSKLE